MMNNKSFSIIIFALSVIAVLAITVMGCFAGQTSEDPQMTDIESTTTDTLPEDHVSSLPDVNVFSVRTVDASEKTITVRVSLEGRVSLCRYSIVVKYDSNVLKLVDYNEELSAFSPIVNPEKDENGDIVTPLVNGIVNCVWANAQNVGREGAIIDLTFEKSEAFGESTVVVCRVKGINALVDDTLREVEYNTRGLTIEKDVFH